VCAYIYIYTYIYIYIYPYILRHLFLYISLWLWVGIAEKLCSNIGCRVGQHLELIPAATAGRGFVRSESSCDGIANIAKRTESR
jgi:hypothetical protein